MSKVVEAKTKCYHCGEDCDSDYITIQNKSFCCNGCKMVYEIINKNDLCTYYDITKNAGISQKKGYDPNKFSVFDNENVVKKIIQFSDEKNTHVSFFLPQMHCSSCIWLLENLYKLNNNIISSKVNFLKKEITIIYLTGKISVKEVVEILASVGYEPHFSLEDISNKKTNPNNKKRIFKLGIAGFCFANIMMLSFPEYFSLEGYKDENLLISFAYLNLLLSLPVFFYSSSEFYLSAWNGLKNKFLNIDAPIALAIIITFARSIYEIITHTGSGYLDSMSGIVFFMLIGRVFQNKTYEIVSFEHDYKSYFPISINVKTELGEKSTPLTELKVGDRIFIKNNEIVPADAILFLGKANIDYSFVTGESLPVKKGIGEIIYAGGKQIGETIEMEIVKEVSKSYLTQLWNNSAFSKNKQEQAKSFIHKLSHYFTLILFAIALATTLYWYFNDSSKILNSVTAILIVACPCALLLSATFTSGNSIRILGKNKFYVKNEGVIESIAKTNTILFDKTGTITNAKMEEVVFNGVFLTDYYKSIIKSVVAQSNHPLSKSIYHFLKGYQSIKLDLFKEIIGEGIIASVDGIEVKMGSRLFVLNNQEADSINHSRVYVSINKNNLGYFQLKKGYRKNHEQVIFSLKQKYKLLVVSGDNNAEEQYLKKIFGEDSKLLFFQSPQKKLELVENLKQNGCKVMMIGDGLNDSGALAASDVGISISEDTNNFSPACDVIVDASVFDKIPVFIKYCTWNKKIILWSFTISIIYNAIGLFYAVQGILSPVIAAILMPISSISIVLFTTATSSFLAKLLGVNRLKSAI